MSSKWFLVLLGTLTFAALSWSQDLGEWTDSYVKSLAPAKHFRGIIVAERNGRVLVEKSYVLVQPEMEKRRSPLVSIPPFGRGFSRHGGLSIWPVSPGETHCRSIPSGGLNFR